MTSITGTIRIGEANKACGRIRFRQIGSMLFFYGAMILFVGAGIGLGWLADYFRLPTLFDFDWWFTGLMAGLLVNAFAMRRLSVLRFRKKLTDKGVPLDMPVRMEVAADGLVYELAGVHHRAPWPVVSELFAAKGYWIFMVVASPWFAPKRLFANEAAERAFVRAALAHMSDEARARSVKAAKFAEGIS